MRKIETILTIAGILIVVMFLSLPTNVLADQENEDYYYKWHNNVTTVNIDNSIEL